jgi:hypothetical protein
VTAYDWVRCSDDVDGCRDGFANGHSGSLGAAADLAGSPAESCCGRDLCQQGSAFGINRLCAGRVAGEVGGVELVVEKVRPRQRGPPLDNDPWCE